MKQTTTPASTQLTTTKSYLFGGQRVAMRVGTGPQSAVYSLHGDHPSTRLRTGLGSTSLTTDASGALVSQARYTPFGGLHWESGEAQTDFGFTGQRAERYIKLLDYGARWYDARLGRFISADSIIPGPGNPMAYDRFSYVQNNPCRYSDPTGHKKCEGGKPDVELPAPEEGMMWRYMGKVRVSNYIIASEAEYSGRKVPIQIRNPKTKEYQTYYVTEALLTDLGGIFMQGTARANNGQLFHPVYPITAVHYYVNGVEVTWLNRRIEGHNIVGWVPKEYWEAYNNVGSAKLKQRYLEKMLANISPWGAASFGGFETITYEWGAGAELEPYGTVGADRDTYPQGSSIYLDGMALKIGCVRAWNNPRYLKLSVTGPDAGVSTVLNLFNAHFGGEIRLSESQLQNALLSLNSTLRQGAWASAKLWADDILKHRPKESQALFALGVVHAVQKEYDRAEFYLAGTLEISPDHYDAC